MKRIPFLASCIGLCFALVLAGCQTGAQPDVSAPTPEENAAVLQEYLTGDTPYYHSDKADDPEMSKPVIELAVQWALDSTKPLEQRFDATYLVMSWDKLHSAKEEPVAYTLSGPLFAALLPEIDWCDDDMYELISRRASRDEDEILEDWLIALYQTDTDLFAPRLGAILTNNIGSKWRSIPKQVVDSLIPQIIAEQPEVFFQVVEVWLDSGVFYDNQVWMDSDVNFNEQFGRPYEEVYEQFGRWREHLDGIDGQLCMTKYMAEQVGPRMWEEHTPESSKSNDWYPVSGYAYVPSELMENYIPAEGEIDFDRLTDTQGAMMEDGKILIVNRIINEGELPADMPRYLVCTKAMTALPPERVPASMEDVDLLVLVDTEYVRAGEYFLDPIYELETSTPLAVGYSAHSTLTLYNYRTGERLADLGIIVKELGDTLIGSQGNNFASRPVWDIITNMVNYMGLSYPALTEKFPSFR